MRMANFPCSVVTQVTGGSRKEARKVLSVSRGRDEAGKPVSVSNGTAVHAPAKWPKAIR